MPAAEEKKERLGEFLDYYTDDLIKYKPFADEFNPAEIAELLDFRDFLFAAVQTEMAWQELRSRAKNLLDRLRTAPRKI